LAKLTGVTVDAIELQDAVTGAVLDTKSNFDKLSIETINSRQLLHVGLIREGGEVESLWTVAAAAP